MTKRNVSPGSAADSSVHTLTRRQVVRAGALGLAAAVLPRAAIAGLKRSPSHLRNVLLVINSAEQSWDRLSSGLNVPARERMLSRAVEFRDFNAACPTPTPALAALLTGRHGPTTGVTDDCGIPILGTALDPEVPTLASVMREAGWHTAFFGDWPLSMPVRPRHRNDLLHDHGFGWCELSGLSGNRALADRLTTHAAATWLSTRATTLVQPWLAVVRLGATAAVTATPPLLDTSPGDPGRPTMRQPNTVAAHRTARHISRRVVGWPRADEQLHRQLTADYESAIETSDQRLGDLLDAMEASGGRSRTIVIYTSDCAPMLSRHGQVGPGPFTYNDVVNVPLLIDDPAAPGAVAVDPIMSGVDLMPTILSLARLPSTALDSLPGYAMSRIVSAPRSKGPPERRQGGALITHSPLSTISEEMARATHTTEGGMMQTAAALVSASLGKNRGLYRAAVTRRYKVARYFAPNEHHTPRDAAELTRRNDVEIYNRHRDPEERRNLANKAQPDPELYAELNAKLNTLVADEIGDDDGCSLPGPCFLWRD